LATERDPEFAAAHALLGGTYLVEDVIHGVPDEERLTKAEAAVDRAFALDPSTAEAHAILGTISNRRGAHRDALRSIGKAIELSPSYDTAYLQQGFAHLKLRQWELARESLEMVLELHPRFPHVSLSAALGCAYYFLGEGQRGLGLLDQARRADFAWATVWLIDHYANEARREEASRFAHALRQQRPELTADHARSWLLRGSGCPPEHPERVLANLRSAGLP
jgi:tetratricopeptide (TPR) repeat protein